MAIFLMPGKTNDSSAENLQKECNKKHQAQIRIYYADVDNGISGDNYAGTR